MYTKFEYLNGLQAIIKPQQETASATVLVMVKVGSRWEKKSLAGIAHFTEHLMFKGTKRRPSTLAISQELDSVGADYNAFTSKEYTGYYIKIASEHLPMAIDMLSDMLMNSKFDSAEIAREKGVILEEIKMYEDTPMMTVEDVFDSVAYRGNSLSRDVAGSKATVSGMNREKFMNFFANHYIPTNMLVSIAGNVDIAKTSKMIERKFKTSKLNKKKPKDYKKFASVQDKARVFIKKKKTEQMHLALGFVNRVSHTSSQRLPLQLAGLALGGNMSSRLFINIRERHGLCYYIRSRVNAFMDVGNFTVYAGIDKERLEMAVELIIKELVRIKYKGLTGKELQKAKDYLKGKLVLSLEDSSHQAQWYAERWLWSKKIETPEELVKRLEAVKLREVNQIVSRIIQRRWANLALIGDYNKKANLINLLKKLI